MRAMMLCTNDRWHDYEANSGVLQSYLEKQGWTVCHVASPDQISSEALQSVDCLIVVGGYIEWAGGQGMTERSKLAVRQFIEKGGALAILHGGVGCFESWDLYRSLAGRMWVRDVSYHPPYGPIYVEISRPAHPACQGLGDFVIDDELYFLSPTGNHTPIAYAEHEGKRTPVAWVSTYESGRIFVCTLGHDVHSVRHPSYLGLVERGIQWAVRKDTPAAATAASRSRSNSEKLKVGLIGAGHIAQAHIHGYRAYSDHVTVTAIAEPVLEAAERASSLLDGAKIYRRWEDLVAESGVDAVDICLPHDLHAPVAIAAAQAGLHVLVEKPIARNLEEADEMIAACDRAGVKLMVMHDRRFHPVFNKVKEIVEAGTIGRVLSARLDHNQNLILPTDSWIRSKERLGGGAILSCLVHQFDVMRWYCGAVAEVGCFSLTWPERMEGEVIGVVPMRFRSGAVGDAVINWAVKPGALPRGLWGEMIWLSGEEGSLHTLGGVHVMRYEDDSEYRQLSVEQGGGHERAIAHFVDCILDDKEPLTNGRESRATLEVAIAAYHSEAKRRFINIPMTEGM